MDRLTREQQQAMLMTEHGGMTEVLANLYAVTGNPEHLRIARMFDHEFLLGRLAKKVDPLNGLHANTQIPKVIGAAREYEVTGDERYRDIAAFFWERVALHRSYANGGHSDDEAFFPVEEFSRHLGPSTSETCNTYNMLKLTRHLFAWHATAEYADYYERALYNHILASQDPDTGMMCYFVPLKLGDFKRYSNPFNDFTCCHGTGMENHAKYGDSIYFHDGDKALYVNRERLKRDFGVYTDPHMTKQRDNLGPITVPPEAMDLSKWVVPPGATQGPPWSAQLVLAYEKAVVDTYVSQLSLHARIFVRNSLKPEVEAQYRSQFESGKLGWFHTSSEAEPRSASTENQYRRFYEDCRSGKTVGYAEPWASAWGDHGGKWTWI